MSLIRWIERLPKELTVDAKNCIVYQNGGNIVARATHEKWGNVIVKLMETPIQQGNLAQRFEKEFRVAKLMSEILRDNPELVYQMYEVIRIENDRILVMEDFGAKPFRGKISLDSFFSVSVKIAMALEKFHANRMVHLDLKPENILVNDDGDAKIIDYGTVEFLTIEKSQLRSDDISGRSIAYMSPEQSGMLDDEHMVDHKSDIYSLGCTFYHFLTGNLVCPSLDRDEIISFHLNSYPTPPHEVDDQIPKGLSDLVMKMMAKNAKDRYLNTQTLVKDLEFLQSVNGDAPSDWIPGTGDIDPMFSLPSHKLYGRNAVLDELANSIECGFESGNCVSYISGPSGIGKSALVQKVVNQLDNINICQGKYEQHRSVPFSAVVNCLNGVVDLVLSKPRKEFQDLKALFSESLGSDAILLQNFIPRLDFLDSDSEPVILEGKELISRFTNAIIFFLSVFTTYTKEILLFFIDDLQWADLNSLLLLEALIQEENLGVVIVGAYRDNEVDETHPLTVSIQSMEKQKIRIDKIHLDELPEDAVLELVADTLRTEKEVVQELANIVYQRTAGNPFFTRQFLKNLYTKGMITFDFEQGIWAWNAKEISEESFAENVVDFMLENIATNATDCTKEVLSYAACVGTVVQISDLNLFYPELSKDDLNLKLIQGLQEGWIFAIGQDKVKFAHDRIEEAFYKSQNEETQQRNHYILGNKLKSKNSEENVFNVINHLNKAIALVRNNENERIELINLNLTAAKRAIAKCSSQLAVIYCEQSMALLNGWESDFDNSWKIYFAYVEALYYSGSILKGLEEANKLAKLAKSDLDYFTVSRYVISMYTNLAYYDDCYDALIECIVRGKDILLDIEVEEEEKMIPKAIHHYQIVLPKLSAASKDPSLIGTMNDPKLEALLTLIGGGLGTFFLTAKGSRNMYVQVVVITTQLILEKGLCEGAVVLGSAFSVGALALSGGNVDICYMGSKLIYDLTQKRFPTDYMRVEAGFHHAIWLGKEGITLKQRGETYFDFYRHGIVAGNMLWSAYCGAVSCLDFFYGGLPLVDVRVSIDSAIGISQKTSNALNLMMLQDIKNACLYLEGKRENLTQPDEFLFREVLPPYDAPFARCITRFLRAWVGILLDSDYKETYQYACESEAFLADVASFVFMYYMPFVRLVSTFNVIWYNVDVGKTVQELIVEFRTQITAFNSWYGFYEHYFFAMNDFVQTLDLILQSEFEGNSVSEFKIIQGIERAIKNTERDSIPQWGAYFNHFYGKFAKKHNLSTIYAVAIVEARNRYKSIGYEIIGTAIEHSNPQINFQESKADAGSTTSSGRTSTIANTGMTTTRSSGSRPSGKQASLVDLEPQEGGQVDIKGLFSNLLPIILQNTGATSAALVLNQENEIPVVAGIISSKDSEVQVLNEELSSQHVSVGMVNTVMRSGRHVEANDVSSSNFKQDQRLKEKNIQSALAIAIPYQRKTRAVIYLEHELMKDVFSKSKIDILHAILAVSLHNAEIFSTLNDSYSRFLPRDFLNVLGKKNVTQVVAGDATETDLCVLFMDIRSFTARTEKLSAKGSMKFVNTFMEYVCPAIEKSHGIIDKFIGDAIMALFTGPESPANAMAGAIKMMEAVDELNEKVYSKAPVKIGIGIHFGKVMMGTVGYANRLDGTVIGDTVNQSSRCEGLTKALGAEIIVTDELIESAKQRKIMNPSICTRKLGKFLVKGKDFPIELFHAYGKEWKIDFATDDSGLSTAMELFHAAKFDDSLREFQKLQEKFPSDELINFYINASTFYSKWKLPSSWNGEIRLNKDGECQGIGELKELAKSTDEGKTDNEANNQEKDNPTEPTFGPAKIVWDVEAKKYKLTRF